MDEHLGPYTLHLLAWQLADGRWDPFITVDKFDESAGDFLCVAEKQRVSAEGFATYEEAIEAARLAGNRMVETWQREQPSHPPH